VSYILQEDLVVATTASKKHGSMSRNAQVKTAGANPAQASLLF
jgi:hypothetical protein